MRAFIFTAAAAASTLVALAPAAAAREWHWNERGWRTIGYTRVDGRDSDTIALPGRTRQSAIRLCAINQPLHLRDFDIRFENGRKQDVDTREVLRAGTCTRSVDLNGNRRDIASVRLRYDPIRRTASRPVVRVQVRA